MPIGEKFYSDDIITDSSLRQIAAEIIREAIIKSTKDEIPHNTAVLIDSYSEKEELDAIKATIIVNQDSQKGILIGKQGSMLKKIGINARKELEKIVQKKVYLELFVKVQKNWVKDKKAIIFILL